MKRNDPKAVHLSPALAAGIAEGVRRRVLQADDNMREFPPESPNGLLFKERRKRLAEAKAPRQGLLIDIPDSANCKHLCHGWGRSLRTSSRALGARVEHGSTGDRRHPTIGRAPLEPGA